MTLQSSPPWWPQACNALSRCDPVMARLAKAYGKPGLRLRGELFFTLARAIVGQQISVKAAQSVWERLLTAVESVAPDRFLRCGPQGLTGLGLSGRKVEYLLDLSGHFAQEPTLAEQLVLLDDEQIIERLIQIRGIGRWSAEMALIFSLGRPNVLPLADLGLMKAISLHYCKGDPLTPKAARAIAEPWAPWQSAATWLLWRSLDPEPVEY
jgi:DNA-3-methyladenine glycosylase II